MDKSIYYKSGYKYQLTREFNIELKYIKCNFDVFLDYIELTDGNKLKLKKGYAWDGASGPTIDTPSSIRPSAVHDALYQLIRLGFLNEDQKENSDKEFYDLCIADGMWKLRAKLWLRELTKFGGSNIKYYNEKKEKQAP